MHLGMYLGMSLRMSQALEMRQTMEMTLTEGLFMRQSLKLALTIYRKREGELTRLYLNALKRGMVKLYDKHGMKFEFALVRVKDVPADPKVSGQMAFSHCLFDGLEAFFFGTRYALSRGSWLLFVIYDMYPSIREHYIEYAAVHERGEQVTLGDHNFASKLEFAIAKKENNLIEYMRWLEAHNPGKFADVFSYQAHLKLPADDEFQEVLESFSSSEEATKVRQMIKEFEWPYHLLQKLTSYKKKNEKMAEIVDQTLHIAENLAGESGIPLKELVGRIRDEVAKHLRVITERKLKRYISFPRLDALWHELRIGVDRKFVEMLNTKQRTNPNYLQELLEAGIRGDGLPRDGVLSFSFAEALKVL